MPENAGLETKPVAEQLDTRERVMEKVKELREEANKKASSALRAIAMSASGEVAAASLLTVGLVAKDAPTAVIGGFFIALQGVFVYEGAQRLREANQMDNRAHALEGAVVARVLAENESKQ